MEECNASTFPVTLTTGSSWSLC